MDHEPAYMTPNSMNPNLKLHRAKSIFRSLELAQGEPYSPLISCLLLPLDFLTCDDILDHKGNVTAQKELGYGCLKFGGQKYHDVEFTSRRCTALPDIECYGPRTFLKPGFPCIRYTNHFFLTTLIYSIFLGVAGIDRFCLGHVGSAVAKLLTLGGLGIWWALDVLFLVFGQTMPEDGSNWITTV